ncbi:MAG: helix-turn-helix domain-containing protein [Aliarcobacter sp.]|nr:helix-turn-helix domain-containing protein [Aliarcobacter sp.]
MQGTELKKIRESMGVTQPALAEYLGVSVRQIGNFENGKTPIKDLYAEKISSFFRLDGTKPEISDLVTINLYEDIQASAGYGANNDDIVPVKLQFDKNFLRQFFNITSFDNLDIIRVIGDSMLPAIKDGEYIIVERGFTARNGDTVIANIDGELYVKRLYKIPLEQWVRLESENDSYPPIELNTPEKLQAFRIVGVVKSKIKLY